MKGYKQMKGTHMENNNNDKELKIYPINYEDGYTMKEFNFNQAFVMVDDIYELLDFYFLYDDNEDKDMVIEELSDRIRNLRNYILNFIS